MRYNVVFQTLLLLLGSVFTQTLFAHEAGITDTSVQISRNSLLLTYTAPADLISSLPLDPTQPADQAKSQAIMDGFSIHNGNTRCIGVALKQQLLEAISSAQFEFRFSCGAPITDLTIGYELFFEQEPAHSNVLRIALLGRFRDVTLSADQREHRVDVKAFVMELAQARQTANNTQSDVAPAKETLFGTHYFPIGLEHILLGFDHVLFLVCLVLLPMSPLAILTLITSFTVAHSITLSLSVLDVMTLAPRLVEALIALSIVYVSLRTIMILRRADHLTVSTAQLRERLLSSFFFGLIHGFGFSYLLKEIGLGDQAFGALLFFNLGVEAGQLIILAMLLPLICLLAKRFPSWYWARGASMLTGLIGLYWLIERLATA